jgi:hypothetical protein
MTRGTFYYIYVANGEVFIRRSVEFNGDMYFEGLGKEALTLLLETKVNSPYDFELRIKEFDKEHFNYQGEKNGYFQFWTDTPGNKEYSYFKTVKKSYDKNIGAVIIDSFATYHFTRDDGEEFDFSCFSSDHEFFINATKDIQVIILTSDYNTVTLEPGEIADLPFMCKKGSWKYNI